MNITKITILSALAIGMFACGGEEKTETTTKTIEEVVEAVSYTVDNGASKVAWSGGTSGVQVYGHNGVINISKGSLELTGEMITSGSITIDMTTIQPLDTASFNEEHPIEKLIGHLSAGDFFLVDSFPTANFVVKSATEGSIIGDLTIRGKTNEETLTGVVIETTEDGAKVSGKLVFDRQEYDVAWAHYMQDVILSDDIELNIEIIANK